MKTLTQPKMNLDPSLSLLDWVHQQLPILFAPSPHPAVGDGVDHRRWEEALLAPMNDILSRPGKAIRARLVEAGYALVRPGQNPPAAAPALVEILHAGSLIVDDIEDDSKLRRGGRTVHRVHGMPKALNAGNWMYFLAVRQIEELPISAEAKLKLYRMANQTMLDCHRGQALDLSLRVGDVPQSEVPTVVAETSLLKTGALTALACGLGVLIAGGSERQMAAMESFGRELGLALQQLDDLGNLTGKGPPSKRHEDLRNGRLTWPWAWAAELLDPSAYRALERAASPLSVSGLGGRPNPLPLADTLLRLAGAHRRHFIVRRLRSLLDELSGLFTASDEIGRLRDQIRTLEESYV
ncbi:MAG: polyprenyl synthetase family protein [Polyangia bacterium]